MPNDTNPNLNQSSPPERRKTPRRQSDRRLLRRDREFEAARQISEALSQCVHTDDLIEMALTTALEVVGTECGSILIAEPEERLLVFRHSVGVSVVQSGTAIPWDSGIAGNVFHSGKPVIIKNVKKDKRHCPDIDILTSHITRDLIALPLRRRDGQPMGVLEVLNKREGVMDEEDLALLTIVSAITASSIEQARLFEEAKLAEVGRLLGDISHDVHNLLMPLITGRGLLEGEIKELFESLPEREREKVQPNFTMCQEIMDMFKNSTRRISDRMKEITDCVKGLSTEPRFETCHIGSVIKAVFEALNWSANQKKISLKSEGLDSLPSIFADERRLFNAFYNLINNAIPEVPLGGEIRVLGKEDQKGAGIYVSVADTGGGMEPEIAQSLFTARAISRKKGGTGLGTKIVKDVVDAHSGKISVESEMGKGTTFHLFFPKKPLSENPEKEPKKT